MEKTPCGNQRGMVLFLILIVEALPLSLAGGGKERRGERHLFGVLYPRSLSVQSTRERDSPPRSTRHVPLLSTESKERNDGMTRMTRIMSCHYVRHGESKKKRVRVQISTKSEVTEQAVTRKPTKPAGTILYLGYNCFVTLGEMDVGVECLHRSGQSRMYSKRDGPGVAAMNESTTGLRTRVQKSPRKRRTNVLSVSPTDKMFHKAPHAANRPSPSPAFVERTRWVP